MCRPALRLAFAVVLFLGCVPLGAQEEDVTKIIEAIEKVGGKFKVDAKAKGRPIVLVDLALTKADDALLGQLKGLKQLERLSLAGTKITDAGLAHLKDMHKLQLLALPGTKITDKGVAHLKDLKELRVIHLNNTKITDEGLSHLKGLSQLEGINLLSTAVTDAGVKELQRAIPKLKVMR